MKKILFALLLLSGIANAQIANIPNGNFKTLLLSTSPTLNVAKDVSGLNIKIDANNDGQIQISEAMAVYEMEIVNYGIADFTGIENFVNLKVLIIKSNPVVTLSLTGLPTLHTLRCDSNILTSLNVSGLFGLTTLHCNNNQLTTLDLTTLQSLEALDCSNNRLESINISPFAAPTMQHLAYENNPLNTLDISVFTNLYSLNCSGNGLTSINLAPHPNLHELRCNRNELTALNLTPVPNLSTLECFDNNLASLDLSLLNNLTYLSCGQNPFTTLNCENNSLTYLSIYNSSMLESLFIKNGSDESAAVDPGSWIESWLVLPRLRYVCADESQVQSIQQILTTAGSSAFVSSYCTFVPGGDFNTITGSIKFDGNNNGCDASDSPFPYIKMKISNGMNEERTMNATSSNYSFYANTGTFTITPEIENPSFFIITPANSVVNFPLLDNSISTNNFCIVGNGIHPDLEIAIAPIVPARPGFEAVYEIVYKNKGNQVLSQNNGLSFSYNQNLATFISAGLPPQTQAPGNLTWSYADLLPFESRSILVTLRINSPMDANPVNINDILIFNASIATSATDENIADNSFALNQIVVGSFDPNDIQCLQGDVAPASEIGKYLHYLIRFENTGTDFAQNIVVRDIIDTTKYDASSIQILNSSHPVEARLRGNIAELIFEDIYLNSGGHGNILLKIKSLPSLNVGSTVSNSASIFFDYNFPVDTNDANTIFQVLSIGEKNLDNSVKIYPNPANEFVNIQASSIINSIEMYDVQGRVLITSFFNETTASADLSKYSSGIYYLKIKTERGSKIEKLIKK